MVIVRSVDLLAIIVALDNVHVATAVRTVGSHTSNSVHTPSGDRVQVVAMPRQWPRTGRSHSQPCISNDSRTGGSHPRAQFEHWVDSASSRTGGSAHTWRSHVGRTHIHATIAHRHRLHLGDGREGTVGGLHCRQPLVGSGRTRAQVAHAIGFLAKL